MYLCISTVVDFNSQNFDPPNVIWQIQPWAYSVPVMKLLHGLVQLRTTMPAAVHSVDEVLGSTSIHFNYRIAYV